MFSENGKHPLLFLCATTIAEEGMRLKFWEGVVSGYSTIDPTLERWGRFQTSFDALRILVATGGFNPDRWFCFTAYYSFSFPFIHSSTSKVMSILWYLCMGGRILVHNRGWLERTSSWFHKNNLLSLPSRNYFVQPSL